MCPKRCTTREMKKMKIQHTLKEKPLRQDSSQSLLKELQVVLDSPSGTALLALSARNFGWTKKMEKKANLGLNPILLSSTDAAVTTGAYAVSQDGGTLMKNCPREPQSIISVSYIRKGGPAAEAGLCIGDNIICVNGENVLGKTCSQVATLIQNCSILELTIVPKKEGMLKVDPEEAHSEGDTNATQIGDTNAHIRGRKAANSNP